VKYIDPDGRDVRLIGPAIIVTALVVGSSVVANDAGIKERFVAGVSESARRLRQAVGSLTFSNGTEQPGAADGQPREGEAGGEGAGKGFSEKDKEIIRKRDGYKCVFCKTETTDESGPDKSEIDHSQPKSKGGNNSENNGQNTCRTCNRQKGAKSTGEFLDWLFGQNK
jgi:HNH endonuclease